MKEIVIVSAARTPVGSFNGALPPTVTRCRNLEAVSKRLARVDGRGEV